MSTAEFVPYQRHVAQAIRRARQDLGLEQQHLGQRMRALGHSWHPQTVSTVEQGKRKVPVDELLGLSVALQVPISTLLTPSGGSQPPPGVSFKDGNVMPSSVVAAAAGAGYFESWVHWTSDHTPIWPDNDLIAQRLRLDYQVAEASRDLAKAARESPDDAIDADALDPREAQARATLYAAIAASQRLKADLDDWRERVRERAADLQSEHERSDEMRAP